MCGGSAPGQVQKTEWNGELGPRWIGTFTNAEQQLKNPYAKYPGGAQSRYAQLMDNPNHLTAIGNMGEFTHAVKSPKNAMNAGIDQIEKTAKGEYLNANPYGGQMDNPWVSQYRNNTAMNVANKYGGNSPQFEGMLQAGREGITDDYNHGTSAELTRMMNLSGAFGGSAHQDAMARNQANLGKTLSNYDMQMRNSQYDRSAGLEEGRLGRASAAEEGLLTRGNAGWQSAQDRGFQGFENERGRQMQSVGLGQNENQNVLARIQGLINTGDVQQGYNQRNADFAYDEWAGEQNYSWDQINKYADLLSRSMGGGAGINQSIYGGGGSGVSQGIGGLLGLAALASGR